MGVEIIQMPVCWFCNYAMFEIDEEKSRAMPFSANVAPPGVRGTCRKANVNVFIINEGVWEKLTKEIALHKISAQQPCNLAINAENGDLENFAFVFAPKNIAS